MMVWKPFQKKVKSKLKQLVWKLQSQMGYWYCVHCDKYHSKRVVEFNYCDFMCDSVCSQGIIPEINTTLDDKSPLKVEHFVPYIKGKKAEWIDVQKVVDNNALSY